MNADFATFLKDNFLEPARRALVFSSNVLSVNNTFTEFMHSRSEREVKTKKLPVVQSLDQASVITGPGLGRVLPS
jgi:hypothetical protein